MVLPVIVGAARVIGPTVARGAAAGSRTAAGGRAAGTKARDPQLLRRARLGARRFQRQQEALSPEERRRQSEDMSRRVKRGYRALQRLRPKTSEEEDDGSEVTSHSMMSKLAKKVKQVRAAAVGYPTVVELLTNLYIPQLLFYLLGLCGIGLQLIPGVNVLQFGSALLFISFIVIIPIGIFSMAIQWLAFSRGFVDCTGGLKLLIFIFCFTGYCIPFLNFIPWVAVWAFTVVLLQKEPEES